MANVLTSGISGANNWLSIFVWVGGEGDVGWDRVILKFGWKDGGWRLDGWMIGVGFGFLVEVGLVYCAVISMVIRVCEWWMESLVNG